MDENKISFIANRDNLDFFRVLTLLEHWCRPVTWAIGICIEKAYAGDQSWYAFIEEHNKWEAEGYYESQSNTITHQ